MRLHAIVLDLDDTLYDTSGLLLPAADRRAVAAMRAAGVAVGEEHLLRRLREIRATGVSEAFRELARSVSAADAAADAAEAAFFEYEPPDMRLDDDVAAALDALAELAPLALLTAGHAATQRRKVERLGIAGRFVEVRIAEARAAGGKTAALAALLAGRAWLPARTVVVGDRPDGDVRAGNRNGCRTVLVRRAGGEFAAVAPASPDDVPWRTVAHVREVAALLGAG